MAIDLVRMLVERYFPQSDNELSVGGVRISDMAERYGTPVFVYDRQTLDRKFSQLREALPERFEISYSVKANPNQALLRHFLQLGCGLEIASVGEYHQARQAGCPPEKLMFAGPGKTSAELETVLTEGIREIHVESPLEVARIASICRKLGTVGHVAMRVNPAAEAQGGAMRMGGKPLPFGIDEEQIDTVLDPILASDYLKFQGIHLFAGTQILDADTVIVQYQRGLEIARRVVVRVGTPLAVFDFGGGFGVPYFANDHELDMIRLRDGLAEMMRAVDDDPMFEGTRFMVEPGRWLVAESGIYVCRINDIKTSRGKKFLILDGGMHHHLAASGNLGQTIKRNFPVALLTKLKAVPNETVELVGPLCTPLDTLARAVILPAADVGDLVGVFQSGAYARTSSPLGFLSHPTPPEVLVHKGVSSLIRRRGTLADMVQDVCPESGECERQEG